MPRLARKYIDTSYCHIIVQGINREYIFKENHLKDAYKNIFKKNLLETDIIVLAYCIMDNHAHMLLHTNKINTLTQLMHKTNTSYAKLYNNLKKRVGYVFRDRYYTQMILSQKQLFNCISYIHNNPIKANIVNKKLDYKYSSYKEYKGKKELITTESINLAFGNQKNYEDMFDQIHNNKNIEDIIDIKEEAKESNQFIKGYCKEKNKTLKEIINDENEFSNLLLELRHSCGLSLREMAKIFNTNKNRINKIINRNL